MEVLFFFKNCLFFLPCIFRESVSIHYISLWAGKTVAHDGSCPTIPSVPTEDCMWVNMWYHNDCSLCHCKHLERTPRSGGCAECAQMTATLQWPIFKPQLCTQRQFVEQAVLDAPLKQGYCSEHCSCLAHKCSKLSACNRNISKKANLP